MDIFQRTRLLLGDEAMDKLNKSRVAVFGIGGVGGHCTEALVRSGIGGIALIDNDTVAPSNLNRQLVATQSTVGMLKTDAAEARLLDINPEIRIDKYNLFYTPETAEQIDLSQFDYIVDAIDTVAGKLTLAEKAQEAGVPIISSMGAGNKLNPADFEVADIYKTSVCPLAKVMRRECKKRGIKRLKCVYSKELPLVPAYEKAPDGSSRRQVPGSTAFVPSTVGLIIASEVVKDLIK
ncbi:MAG: tRNA threonylcarbamoyladenosine dehydratase [Eubacterium sp.]|nr:tRNA threonylcarbamoyladenosine dehydratase [Eubacterium sp.]